MATATRGKAVEDGSVLTIVATHANNCMGVKGSSTANGALIQNQGCSGSAFQQWEAVRDDAGYYELVNVGSGMCLDVPGGSSEKGVNMQQWGCWGADNQKWNLSDQGDGSFAIINKASGLALDVNGASTVNGARIIQWAWWGGDNQKFELNGATFSGPGEVSGFASVYSHGMNTTTGGGAATPTVVTSCNELEYALEDSTARVVEIPSGTTLDCRTSGTNLQACEIDCGGWDPGKVFWRVPVGNQTCDDLGGGTLVWKTRYDRRIDINSNKTLVGAGSGATLEGVSLSVNNVSNVIIRNLTISEVNPDLVEAGDGVGLENAHHVWIDHCRFSMISDGYFDIRNSDSVTVSWNHIVGKNPYVCGGQHHYIGFADSSTVTYHHNYFDAPSGRNPKVTGSSDVHVYNNYYKDVSYFCLSAATGGEALVEGNLYDDSRYPHWSEGGSIEANANVYLGTSADDGQKRDGGANVFSPAYTYSLDNANDLPTIVTSGVGPGNI